MSPEMMQHHLNSAWMVPFFPFFAFILISIFTIRQRDLSAFISIAAILLSAIFSSLILYDRITVPQAPPFCLEIPWMTIGTFDLPIGVLINNLSAAMLFIVSFIALLIQIYSYGYMENEDETGFSRYYAYMSLFAASMLGLVLSPNFFQIYMFWELVGLCSYLLIGFWYSKKSACDAAKKAFIVTRFGDVGFLIGIIMLYTMTKSFSFSAIPGLLGTFASSHPGILQFIGFPLTADTLINIAMFFVFCGAIGKSAMFPLHVWLPDAMEGPTPVSALIHAATMVAAGVFMVAQSYTIFQMAPITLLLIAHIGGFTALLAATLAVVQNDIKRVLAYSTISQLGYMMMALGAGGYIGGVFHLFTHAFFKALLFLGAGSIIHALHTNNIWEMGKLRKSMGVTSYTFLAGCLALAGIFPFSGFWSKDEILSSLTNSPHVALMIVAYAVVFLTAFYMFRVYFTAFESGERYSHQPRESGLVMTAPLVILSLFAVLLGFVGTPFSNFFACYLTGEVPEHGNLAAVIGPMALSTIIALFGIASAYALYGSRTVNYEEVIKARYGTLYAMLSNKYWIDDFWSFLVSRVLFLASSFISFVDTMIIDRLVNTIAGIADEAGRFLRIEESGQTQHYGVVMVMSLVVIMIGMTVSDPRFVSTILDFICQLAR